ncbi:MAG: hypothetical protein ACJAWV_003763 [Flammeovirgaceae bacterium]|jgi:hypothetical protein
MILFVGNKITIKGKKITFLLGLLLLSHITWGQVIESGAANLVDVDFSKEEPIALDGDWNFHFGKFLSHQQVSEYSDNPSFAYVPGVFTKTTWKGELLDGDGYATY